MKNLLIVESPNKISTIKKALKNEKDEWIVMATLGHVVDLPRRRHGLSLENGEYIPEWEYIQGKKKVVQEITSLAKEVDNVYVATDDDREGEKIADDIVHYCKLQKHYRVVFHEITRRAVLAGISNARTVSEEYVLAQKARRFIDREVGYKVSEVIRWSMREKGTDIHRIGVGRVVSPALHLLCLRERDIEQFVAEKQFKIAVDYVKDGVQFRVMFGTVFSEETKTEMNQVFAYLGNKANHHIVQKYKQSTKEVAPFPPLITSRLQRGAFYLFNFDPNKTMKLAQKLFEAGLITYIRTDSYNISDDVVYEIIEYLNEHFPEEDVLQHKRVFKSKKEGHDAHEAIRPVYFTEEYTPDTVRQTSHFRDHKLTEEHRQVYEYIWYVTMATQMVDSVYDNSELTVQVGENIMRVKANSIATTFTLEGEEVKLYGWEKLQRNYLKTAERDNDEDYKDREVYIPRMTVGDELKFVNIDVVESLSKRPPRYGIGRFISVLEDKGIGRPSTFASIYQKLVDTGCVRIIGGQMLQPQKIGFMIDDWIKENCEWMHDINQAKEFEELLDAIESGEVDDINPIVNGYTQLINYLYEKVGFTPDLNKETNTPSEAQISFYRRIIKQEGMSVDERLLNDREKLSAFLTKYNNDKTVCKCPVCKTGAIQEKSFTKDGHTFEYYKCTNNDCDFTLGDTSIDKFFAQKGIDLNKEERRTALKNIASKKRGFLFTGFISSAGKKYDAKVKLGKYFNKTRNKEMWTLQLNFDK